MTKHEKKNVALCDDNSCNSCNTESEHQSEDDTLDMFEDDSNSIDSNTDLGDSDSLDSNADYSDKSTAHKLERCTRNIIWQLL